MNTVVATYTLAGVIGAAILGILGYIVNAIINKPTTDAQRWNTMNTAQANELKRLSEKGDRLEQRVDDLEAWKRHATDVIEEMADTLDREGLPKPASLADLKL